MSRKYFHQSIYQQHSDVAEHQHLNGTNSGTHEHEGASLKDSFINIKACDVKNILSDCPHKQLQMHNSHH